jgi:hypothetical protein
MKRGLCLTILACGILFSLAVFGEVATAAPPESSPEANAELSAQRAVVERGKMYQAGVIYSHWLDRVARQSDYQFLQERVFDGLPGCIFWPAPLLWR